MKGGTVPRQQVPAVLLDQMAVIRTWLDAPRPMKCFDKEESDKDYRMAYKEGCVAGLVRAQAGRIASSYRR